MSWRGAALALVALLLDFAASSCISTRRWAADESDRIDSVMVEARPDAGEEDGEEDPLPQLAMGPAPELAPPTPLREQLTPATPWSQPPWRRGTRWYLGRRRRSAIVGRDADGAPGGGATR